VAGQIFCHPIDFPPAHKVERVVQAVERAFSGHESMVMAGNVYRRVGHEFLFLVLVFTDSCRTVLESPALDGKILQDVFVKYGKSARHCYKLAGEPDEMIAWENSIPRGLRSIPEPSAFLGFLRGVGVDHNSDAVLKASSQLLTISPDTNRRPHVNLVSRHVGGHLFETIIQHDAARFWDYFNQFDSVPQSRGSGGWLWELHVLKRELSGVIERRIPLKHLPPSPSRCVNIDLPFSSVKIFGSLEDLAQDLARMIPKLLPGERVLFMPAVGNQATFDAFTISAEGLVAHYQVTSRGNHPFSPRGLDFLWDVLLRVKQLLHEDHHPRINKLFPTKRRKWRLIFVIPQRRASRWKNPQSIDSKGVKLKRKWGDYLAQFVMVLKDVNEEGEKVTKHVQESPIGGRTMGRANEAEVEDAVRSGKEDGGEVLLYDRGVGSSTGPETIQGLGTEGGRKRPTTMGTEESRASKRPPRKRGK
jgi:hypothetical protein